MNLFNKGSLTELKSLANPPQDVKRVLCAALILLGHDSASAQDWRFAQKQMATQTFLQDMAAIKAGDVSPKAKTAAMEQLKDLSFERVAKSSMAAADMVKWCLDLTQ